MRYALLALALAFAPSAAFAQKESAGVEDRVVGYHESDRRMNGAIEQARLLLPLFLDEFRNADLQVRSAYAVKAALRTGSGGLEHIWIGDLRYEDDQLVGSLFNEPYDLPGMRLGSRVEVRIEDISDWSIATTEGTYGAFTSRVMIEDMPPEQAAQYREALRLTASPTPPRWIQ